MKKTITFPIIFLLITIGLTSQTNFLSEQKKQERVRTAIKEKNELIENKLKNIGLNTSNFDLLIVAYKNELELELYVKEKNDSVYQKFETYPICARSGKLGPKRRQGDEQIPEGFYMINRFNPTSNFYLSLGINYPNSSDRIKSKAPDLGGDIFIHGNCVSIGCLAMTDDKIKEIYLYAVHAKNNGQQQIPVYIFPFKMTNISFKHFKALYNTNTSLIDFWIMLKKGYNRFFTLHKELHFTIDKSGNYSFYD